MDTSKALYEYYLTKEELLADVEQGIIFRVDTAFQKPMCPIVTGGNWSFYAHEDNVVNLEVSYSNLVAKNGKTFSPFGEQVMVDVISPDGDCAYHFEKLGDEIMQDASIQEQIAVTPGEWKLKISFVYVCDEAPSYFKVCAAYESPSEEDIRWLQEARLKEHDAGIQPASQDNAADFALTDDGKQFLENICKTVNDFDSGDEKDAAFWRDFLFLAYTGLWEDEAERRGRHRSFLKMAVIISAHRIFQLFSFTMRTVRSMRRKAVPISLWSTAWTLRENRMSESCG